MYFFLIQGNEIELNFVENLSTFLSFLAIFHFELCYFCVEEAYAIWSLSKMFLLQDNQLIKKNGNWLGELLLKNMALKVFEDLRMRVLRRNHGSHYWILFVLSVTRSHCSLHIWYIFSDMKVGPFVSKPLFNLSSLWS